MPVVTRLPIAGARIETPYFLSGNSIEGNHPQIGRSGIEQPLDTDRITLHLRSLKGVVRIVAPGDLELLNISRIDLRQGGVAGIVKTAVDGPLGIRRLKVNEGQNEQEKLHVQEMLAQQVRMCGEL